jgi:O-antigen ligase
MWALKGYPEHGTEHLISLAAACLVAEWLSRDEEQCAKWLTYFGLFEAVFGLAQFMGWNPWGYANEWELYKPSGTFGQETILGAFLVAALAPALFSRRFFAALPIFLCAVATKSTMTVLSSAAVVGLWIIAEFGLVAFSAIFGAFFVAATLFLNLHPYSEWGNFNGRIRFWDFAINKWLERPIFGFGPGSWLPEAPVFQLRLTHVHNEFLEFLTEYGSIGGAIGLWALWDFVRSYKPTWHHALCVGLMVNAIGNFPFHIASTGVIFLTGWLLSVRGAPRVLQWKRC